MTDLARLRELLALHDAAQDEALLKQDGRGRVTRIAFDERSDAVCKEDAPDAVRSQIGALIRGSRAARAHAAALELKKAGFRVPEPLGVVEEGGRSIYFARHVPGPTLSAALAAAEPDLARELALSAANLAARLHQASFAFRDLKPPNLIVEDTGEKLRLVPVDLDDVTRPRKLPRRSAWRNLAALDAYAQTGPRPLGVRTRWAALRAYCELRNLAVSELWTTVLQRSREKRRGWQEQARVP